MDLDAARRVMLEISDEADNGEGDVGLLRSGSGVNDPGVPGYRVERLLGEGAGGRVWLARWSRSDRPVALKVLHRRLDGSANARRAWRELDVLSQIRLPCVPRLLDWSTHEGRMYFATEFVDGERIDHACSSRDLTRRQRVGLLAKLATAVAQLHERGVIHRDLKPSNVLVTPAGDPVIIDLGIAAMLGSNVAETLTTLGAPIGTPAFMSPEQARGERSAVGTRSDVYALGAIGYVLLTGETPHDLSDATLFEAVRRVGHDEPRDPASLNRDLERPLSSVLRKASAAEPGSRYSSAAELAQDLERWLHGEPVEAGERSRWTRAFRWLAAHPIAATAAICIAMVLGTVLFTLVMIRWLATQPHTLRVAEDSSSAWIESRAGVRLKSWTSDGTSSEVSAFRASTGRGDGWYAVVSYHDRSREQHIVEVCDPQNISNPVAVFEPGEPVRPPPYRDCEGDIYGPTPLLVIGTAISVGDVFASEPGDEIVIAERHSIFHPTRVSVRSLAGELLASVWVPGHVLTVRTVDGSGLVVLTTFNNYLTRTIAGDCAASSAFEHPIIATGYRFSLGACDDRWITHQSDGSPTDVEWCLLLDEPAKRRSDRLAGVPGFWLHLRRAEQQGSHSVVVLDSVVRASASRDDPSVVFRINPETGEQVADAIIEDGAHANPRLAGFLESLRLIPAPAFDPNK